MIFSIIQKTQLEGTLRLDAEYYQPKFLALNKKLSKNSKLLDALAQKITCGPFGSAILNSSYKNQGVPLLRVSDLNDWFVKESGLVFIDETLSGLLKKYRVEKEDIVVSQRGTIALFSKVTNKFSFWNISANLISIKKSNKIDFNYLLTFLNSKYGLKQLARRLSGQVQPKITTEDIKQISVFLPKRNEQRKISDFVEKSWAKQENSKKYYQQAEALLLKELELENFEAEEKLFSIVNYSDCQKSNRIDADYFQPKYFKLLSIIQKNKSKLLSKLVKRIKARHKIIPDNKYFYSEISNVDISSSEVTSNKIIGKELPANAKVPISGGELIVSKVRPTRGAIAIIPKNFKQNHIISGAFSVFNVESPTREYLLVVLKSIIGKIQMERPTTGTSYPTITDQDIENLLIPVLSNSMQQKISNLVVKTHKARQESKQLLEEAKTKIEEMIEKQ